MRILFDSGCGATIANKNLLEGLPMLPATQTNWKTKNGSFKTNKKCNITFMLPAFHKHRDITWNVHVDDSPAESVRCNMIIGRDLMHEIGMDILFQESL